MHLCDAFTQLRVWSDLPSGAIVMKYSTGRQVFLSTGVRPSRNVSKQALDTNRKQ